MSHFDELVDLHELEHAVSEKKINPAFLSHPPAGRSAPGPSGELTGIALGDSLFLRSHDWQSRLPQSAAFRPRCGDDSTAIVFWGEDRVKRKLSHAEIYAKVSRLAQALRVAV